MHLHTKTFLAIFGATTFINVVSLHIIGTSAIRYAYYAYGRSSVQPQYFTSVSCSGLENQLLNCRFSIGSCYWRYPVGVRCYGKQIYA